MSTLPTHAQHVTRPPNPRLRVLADLCRQRPALFAEVVRIADHLEGHGVDQDEALEQALHDVTARD